MSNDLNTAIAYERGSLRGNNPDQGKIDQALGVSKACAR
jgi:hypothetical protein